MTQKMRPTSRLNPDPTPDEIGRMTEAIRARWTKREQARRAGEQTTPWLPPFVRTADLGDLVPEADITAF